MNTTTNLAGAKAPAPPSLHWGIVLALSFVTFGLFGLFWMFRQAWFARKLNPDNRAILLFAVVLVLTLFSLLMRTVVAITVARGGEATDLGTVGLVITMFQILGVVAGFLQIRETLAACYSIRLNVVLTVLLNVYYIQYHLSRLAKLNQAASPAVPLHAAGSGV